MSDISAPPTVRGRPLPVATGGNATGQVINPPPRLPQLAASGAVIRAVVLGDDGRGRLRLQSDLGQLTLLSSLRLPPGTVVSLQLRPIGGEIHVLLLPDQGRAAERSLNAARPGGAAEPAAAAPSAPAAGAGLATGRWPALEAVLQLLLDRGVSLSSAAALRAPLPHPGRHLAASWIRLLAGYAGDGPRSWLGPLLSWNDLETTQSGRELLRDLGRLAALAAETDAEGWRHLGLPLLSGEQVELRWLRLRGGRDAGGDVDAGTRFLLDVEFSMLGPLQLDGLLHEPRFDLVLRSRGALPESLQEELQAIHNAAAALTGLHGRLRFQADDAWQPLPPPAALAAEGSMVV